MKVCLVDPSRSPNGDAHLLGLGYLAAALLEVGVTPDIPVLEPGESLEGLAARLSAPGCDLLGITCHTRSFPAAIGLARAYKAHRPAGLVVLGGMVPTFRHEQILAQYPGVVDAAVRHEGERVLQEIVRRGGELAGIAGVSFRKEGRVCVEPDATPVADLDRLPSPAWHLLPMASLPVESQGQLLSSRGCPYRCAFCTCAPMFGRVRQHSVSRVLEEIRTLHDVYGLHEITFVDDTFTLDRARVLDLCDCLPGMNLDVTWNCSSRVDAVDPELLSRMAGAGCRTLFFGVESFSPAALAAVHKGTSPQKNLSAIRWAHSAGIRVKCGMIVGLPGETEASMAAALQILEGEGVEEISPSFVTPVPGSELYEEAGRYGVDVWEKDWSRFDYVHPVASLPGWPPEVQTRYFLELMALNARQSLRWETLRLPSRNRARHSGINRSDTE